MITIKNVPVRTYLQLSWVQIPIPGPGGAKHRYIHTKFNKIKPKTHPKSPAIGPKCIVHVCAGKAQIYPEFVYSAWLSIVFCCFQPETLHICTLCPLCTNADERGDPLHPPHPKPRHTPHEQHPYIGPMPVRHAWKNAWMTFSENSVPGRPFRAYLGKARHVKTKDAKK